MKTKNLTILSIALFLLFLFPYHISQAQEPPSFPGQISYIGTDHNVWIIEGKSGERIQITDDADDLTQYFAPRYSPDGSMLAYCQKINGEELEQKLYIMRIGEWQPIQITDKVNCINWPQRSYDWSPDSMRIIFSRPYKSTPESVEKEGESTTFFGIWMVDITTGETSEIIPPPSKSPLTNPDWSPDGAWIKFYESGYFDGLGALMTGYNDTGTIYTWFGTTSVWPGYSDWSPNGSRLVFDEVPFSGFSGAGIYIASPKGENIRKVYANDGMLATKPIWSPDGSTIAFQVKSYSGGKGSLALISPNGENYRKVFSSDHYLIPSTWSPDSKNVIYGVRSGNEFELFIYSLETNSSLSLGMAATSGADWSDAVIAVQKAQEPIVIPDFPFGPSLLTYVAPDRRLVMYDPNDGSEIDLTPPLTVTSYSPSPSGMHYIYGNHLVTLNFTDNNELYVTEVLLPTAPVGNEIRWSIDEEHLAFKDWRGQYWISDLNGMAQQVPNAASLPYWSAGSSMLSFCDQSGVLQIIGGNIQSPAVANNADCDVLWSPSKNILAYNIPATESNPAQVYLLDTSSNEQKLIMQDVEAISWSPDGRLLALKSTTNDQDKTIEYTIYISDYTGEKILKAGTFNENDMDLTDWVLTDSGYLFGKYLIAPNLDSSRPIADALITASEHGNRLLINNLELDKNILSCLDTTNGEQVRALTVDLNNISPDQLPGIWGWMAPDGSWVVTRTYVEGNFANLLLNCNDGGQRNLAFNQFPNIASFSDDGDWFIVSNIRVGDHAQIIIADLGNGGTEHIENLANSNLTWLKTIEKPGIHSITGQITTEEGVPLAKASIFVDGILVTTTDKTGNFVITRLQPGDHEISVLNPGFHFSPSSIKVKLPPDQEGLNFTAKVGNAKFPIVKSTPTIDSTYPFSNPPSDSGIWQDNTKGAFSTIMPYVGFMITITRDIVQGIFNLVRNAAYSALLNETNQRNGLLGITLLLLIAFLVIFFLWKRKKSSATTTLTVSGDSTPSNVDEDIHPVQMSTESMDAPTTSTAMPETFSSSYPAAAITSPNITSLQPEAPISLNNITTSESELVFLNQQIEDWMEEGKLLVRSGNFEAGHALFRKIVQQKPEEAGAWLWLGYLAAREKNWRGAERCFKLAKKYDHPKADQALIWLEKQK